MMARKRDDNDDDFLHDNDDTVSYCGWRIAPIPENLIESPLDMIFADHVRQRQVALLLNRVADGEFDAEGVSALIKFLTTDFVEHVADEELGFFPALKIQCRPEDNVEPLIRRLTDEHREDELIGDEIVSLLRKRLGGTRLESGEKRRILYFAEHIRQHLAMENAILLPIARVRMDEEALKVLSDRLKARRRRMTKRM